MKLKKLNPSKKSIGEVQNDNEGNKFDKLPPDAGVSGVFPTIDENFGFIGIFFGNGIGLNKRKFTIGGGKISAGIAYIESITNTDSLNKSIIAPLIKNNINSDMDPNDIQVLVRTKYILLPVISSSNQMEQVINGLLNGDVIIFIDNSNNAIIAGNRKLEKRAIEKPENETAIFGSQESFTDDLKSNISLIIKRLPHPNLKFEAFTVGKISRTQVRLIWLEGIANPEIIEDVKSRIQKIDMDIVGGIGMLSELIEDNPLSVFPLYKQTERPDITAFNLASGFFAIICSNSPYALIAPTSLWDNFKTMDDYDEKVISANYLRLVRYVAFAVSVLISPLYISFVTYNHSIVPQTIAFTIASGRQGVPFPTVVEVLLMSFAMSIIREAGVRMPGAVGYFIGTLAAVLIGQQIVTAGYVSASMVIVIAISVISSFAISTTTMVYTSRLLNYFFIILSGFFGMFGLINGVAIVLWHLSSQYSFGMPYLYPVVPFEKEGLGDTIIRYQLKSLRKRFQILAPNNRVRVGSQVDDSDNKKLREE